MASVEGKTVSIVIPCYNEELRLSREQIQALLQPHVNIILVNDGSRDNTLQILNELKNTSSSISTIDLQPNRGKAEAVREGLRHALQQGTIWVGYIDADFATPASEVLRLMERAAVSDYNVVLASRVSLLGTNIQRKWSRHYLGRVFATFVSVGLKLKVYDTQCGAKFFRSSKLLENSVVMPFRSRWVFDVELIGRLLNNGLAQKGFLEVPLQTWTDIAGSKLTLISMFKAGWDLIWVLLRFRRQAADHRKASLRISKTM
jgi:dolichyl-phosphate beta-glucosyltransferase